MIMVLFDLNLLVRNRILKRVEPSAYRSAGGSFIN
jgi:hypothetical protein